MFYKHGDVLIQKTNKVKGELKQTNGDLTVVKGDIVEYSHRFRVEEGTVHLYEDSGIPYIKVISEAATIVNEEHKPLTIPQGNYKIAIQREYDPAKKTNQLVSQILSNLKWRRASD